MKGEGNIFQRQALIVVIIERQIRDVICIAVEDMMTETIKSIISKHVSTTPQNPTKIYSDGAFF